MILWLQGPAQPCTRSGTVRGLGKRRRKKREPRGKIRLVLRRVELARGYDGPLRGAPEPRLLFGIYRVTPDDVALVARHVVSVRPGSSFPVGVRFENGIDLSVTLVPGSDLRILVLAAALEEDDGRGVQQLYADLESPARLSAWSVDAPLPDPVPLLEWARTVPLAPPATISVHLVDAAGDLRDHKLGDDWVGAALFHVDPSDRHASQRRMRFVSADGRNDWTAILDVRVR